MRVLVVTNAYPSEAQPIRGIFVQTQVESIRRLGVAIDVLSIEGWRGKFEYVRAVGRVRRAVADTPFDLCHAHYGLSGAVAVCQSRVPVIVSFMGDDVLGTPDPTGRTSWISQCLAGLGRWAGRRAAAVVVKSASLGRALGRPDAHVIPNGVDLDCFRPRDRADARARLGLDPHRRYVLFSGLTGLPVKNFPLAEAAVARARRRLPDLELLLASRVSPAEMPWYFSAADALLLTSRHEGSPNAVKEALACDLPVISVDVGDVRERVEGVDGCHVVMAHDADALATALVDRLREPRRVAGRAAVAPLALDQVARRIVAVYEQVLRAERG